MAIVQYRKLKESDEKVRYVIAPVPEEKYAVEYTKTTGERAVSDLKAAAMADELYGHFIRRELAVDPDMTHLTLWPDSGSFQM